MLPRFNSSNESQSADTTLNNRSNKFDIKFLERTYDRSGKKCWPLINSNIKKMDLEYTYEIVGNTLESYMYYRKLNQCKALGNFIEYRNKVFKREKIGQYAILPPKTSMKDDISMKPMKNIPKKIIHIEDQQTPSPSSSTISEIRSPTPIPSLQSLTPESSQNLSPSIRSKSSQKLPPTIKRETSTATPSPSTTSKIRPATPYPSLQSPASKSVRKLSPPTPSPSLRSPTPKSVQSLSPPTPSPSLQSKTSKLSVPTKNESLIPIPSPDLLKKPSSKQIVSKKTNTTLKQSSSVKGQS